LSLSWYNEEDSGHGFPSPSLTKSKNGFSFYFQFFLKSIHFLPAKSKNGFSFYFQIFLKKHPFPPCSLPTVIYSQLHPYKEAVAGFYHSIFLFFILFRLFLDRFFILFRVILDRFLFWNAIFLNFMLLLPALFSCFLFV